MPTLTPVVTRNVARRRFGEDADAATRPTGSS